MVRSKGLRKRSARKKTRRRRVRNVRQATTPSTQSTGQLGASVARGVRTLVSMLPGSTFTAPMVDFVFKALGWTTDKVTGASFAGNASFVGLAAKVSLTRSSLLMGTPVVSTGYNASVKTTGFTCDKREMKVLSLIIKVTPANTISTRSGFMSIGFQPYYSEEMKSRWETDTWLPDKTNIKKMPFAMSGAADKPLCIRYTPHPDHGDAYQYGRMSENRYKTISYGCLAICYDEPNRTEYTDFKASDFAVSVTLDARIAFRDPIIEFDTMAETSMAFHPDGIVDILAPVATQLMSNLQRMTITKDKNFLCTPNEDRLSCKVTGSVSQLRNTPHFSDPPDFEMV